jgi:hypothetical protein
LEEYPEGLPDRVGVERPEDVRLALDVHRLHEGVQTNEVLDMIGCRWMYLH